MIIVSHTGTICLGQSEALLSDNNVYGLSQRVTEGIKYVLNNCNETLEVCIFTIVDFTF